MDNNEIFYEIEYDSCPMPGVGKFVLKSQKVEQPQKDEIRDLFYQMRDIARNYRSSLYSSNRFYDKRVQRENAKIFYKQGMLMKDFEDQYEKTVTYSSYFPNYQMMGYDQLRTYFTWRTKVRQGKVTETSLSYAFMYIYELLHNIGVADPQDGLEKLMFFWKAFRVYDYSIDKYVLKWLKDYHIYYELPESFQEFIDQNGLREHYPELDDSDDKFELFCGISKYDIRKSKFYTEDRVALIKDCFHHTLCRLKCVFEENGIVFDEVFFQPTKNMAIWTPFKDALFYQWKRQQDRRVVLSKKEIYICSKDNWTFSSVITTESGKRLVGYVMKQMEVVLRGLMKYRFKLSAGSSTVTHEAVRILEQKGISLERVITEAVTEFYREATKTIVKVDPGRLSKIRQEAYITQEKLTVPEEEEWSFAPQTPNEDEKILVPKQVEEDDTSAANPWEELKDALTDTEFQALSIIWSGEADIRKFTDEHGIMLEVLMDGINEKAMDFIGDSLTDDEFIIYEDYIEDVRKMVEGI